MYPESAISPGITEALLGALPILVGPFVLVFALLALLVAGVAQKRISNTEFTRFVSAAFLTALAVYMLTVCTCSYGMYLWDSWQSDQIGSVTLAILLLSTSFIFLFFPKEGFKGPFVLFFALSGILGAWVMVHATHVLSVYLGVELLSMSSYLLVLASREREEAPEAGLKFLVQGGFSAAVLMFGFSLLYSESSDLTFQALGEAFRSNSTPVMYVGAVLSLVGIWFKLALWPIHLWVPGVFAVSRPWVLAYLSIVPKLAGALLAYRWISELTKENSDSLLFFAMFGLLALTAGNLGAFPKKSFRTMMAYSSVAQSGFVWIALVQSSFLRPSVLLFYLLVLTLSNLTVWLLYSDIEQHQGDYMPFWRLRSGKWVFTTVALLTALVSLVGIPVTGGFMAKLVLFLQTWELYARFSQVGWVAILVLGLLNSVLSLFYYIRPFYYGVVKSTSENTSVGIVHSGKVLFGVILLLVLLLGAFFMPDYILTTVN
jgi:NADH-quinone oxidoreductase subunit N